jgi:hypothetical protein
MKESDPMHPWENISLLEEAPLENQLVVFFPFIPGLMNPGYDVLVHGVDCQNENMTNTSINWSIN